MHTHFDAPLQTLSHTPVADLAAPVANPSAPAADPAAPVADLAAPAANPAAPVAAPGALPAAVSVAAPVLPFQRLDAYRVARELARVVCTAGIADAELRDQATRAAKSAFLNLCEGLPDDRPGVRRRYFRQADGSVHEVAGALDLAAAIGALDEEVARQGIALAARVRALLRGLLR